MLKSSNLLKSTEKLIDSDASTEEVIVVPPLDLSKCRQSIGSTYSESSPILTDKKQRVVMVDRADIHRTDEHSRATPTPTARNSLASVRRISSETGIFQQENVVKPAKRTVKSQAMDLIAMAPEIKPRIKKKLFSERSDSAMDETTSFITYEEKHETKNTNEGKEHGSESEDTHCTNVSHQSGADIAKVSAIMKKLPNVDTLTMDNERQKEKEDVLVVHKEGTISITLHATSPLRFDASIRAPRIRLSIFDSVTGHQLRRRAGSDDEDVDASIFSQHSRLKESK